VTPTQIPSLRRVRIAVSTPTAAFATISPCPQP
jgi:hypothetical protein